MAIVVPYGVAITEAIANGDLEEMKRAKALAEDHVQRYGDISALLVHLKAAIAKLEASGQP